jgi:hypothetical protein
LRTMLLKGPWNNSSSCCQSLSCQSPPSLPPSLPPYRFLQRERIKDNALGRVRRIILLLDARD